VLNDLAKFQGDRAMTKSVKHSRIKSRPPVDAIQYKKLALCAFGLIERQLSQLEKLVTFSASIVRSPAVTMEERHRQRKLVELLLDTCEDYPGEVETDHELYQVIALDAKGTPQSRLTARHAADLLTKATETAADSRERIGKAKSMPERKIRFKLITRSTSNAH
jgi:hypothetical protein